MPYKRSTAQEKFLRKKYAKEHDEQKCCDCPGCETCTGFVRGCTCDLNQDWKTAGNRATLNT